MPSVITLSCPERALRTSCRPFPQAGGPVRTAGRALSRMPNVGLWLRYLPRVITRIVRADQGFFRSILRVFPLTNPVFHLSLALGSGLLVRRPLPDKSKPVARRGRKAAGQSFF